MLIKRKIKILLNNLGSNSRSFGVILRSIISPMEFGSQVSEAYGTASVLGGHLSGFQAPEAE
jgi:hypothetical protein